MKKTFRDTFCRQKQMEYCVKKTFIKILFRQSTSYKMAEVTVLSIDNSSTESIFYSLSLLVIRLKGRGSNLILESLTPHSS